ncbi:MAG: heparinase II/III family protein [Bacteroidales bacterium]|nr:heparinase II/III family protein [Bacteroidales bacterium]
MSRYLDYAKIIVKLGIPEVVYVLWYRFTIKTGIQRFRTPKRSFKVNGDIFTNSKVVNDFPEIWEDPILDHANRIIQGEICYYSFHWKNLGSPPNWFKNPFNEEQYPNNQAHWSRLPDFHPTVGDIKNIWEASRLDWIITLSRAYMVSGNQVYLNTVNSWIRDWAIKNPLNMGPNWKCGQEASIRIFNLLNASFILGQSNSPSESLVDLVFWHLQRIGSNIGYALAQNNNHGTSEAAALFIGGCWLKSIGFDKLKAIRFESKGRRWIENRMKKLVDADGGFSQQSVNYHRVVLDTCCMVEFWRIRLKANRLDDTFYYKAKVLTNWLWLVTDYSTGNCPNLGSNDGAKLLNLHSCDYRDFRPSLQLASALFRNTRYFENGPWNEPLYWFQIKNDNTEITKPKKRSVLLKSGYVLLYSLNSWCLLRFPNFRFRPHQNDIFHFDLWWKGNNILCDSGSFSYNPSNVDQTFDFESIHAHNTVCFDDHEPMPRISRSLLGNWINSDDIGDIKDHHAYGQSWEGAYTDQHGNKHKRRISQNNNSWTISDTISGGFKSASIGYNIVADDIYIVGNTIHTSWGIIYVQPCSSFEVKTSYSSHYYWEKHEVHRLIIKLDRPQVFQTEIKLKS